MRSGCSYFLKGCLVLYILRERVGISGGGLLLHQVGEFTADAEKLYSLRPPSKAVHTSRGLRIASQHV